MLVSKNRATNSLLKSEKKSLYRFLALYISMVVLLMTLLSVYYYRDQEKFMLSQQRASLVKYAYIQTKRLKVMHHFFDKKVEYPRDPRFKSSIYDIEFVKIFSLIENQNIKFKEDVYLTDNYIHFIKSLDDYYMGAKYLIVEIEDDGVWRSEIWKDILLYGSFLFAVFLFFGLFLAKMFLKPMRDTLVLLDRFIKDTTHELNTPLSAILANIEMMDIEIMNKKNLVKLNRINIAAKTVSVLYKDLTYLTLEQETKNSDVKIDIKPLINNRAEYFFILAESKKIVFDLDLEDSYVTMDKRKFTRVIDNLISNAIKYNKRDGTIGIILKKNSITIWDTGIGIEKDKLPFVFDRYTRFNNVEGGFGVGLSIVKDILDEYHITIDVESHHKKGTKMVLKW